MKYNIILTQYEDYEDYMNIINKCSYLIIVNKIWYEVNKVWRI